MSALINSSFRAALLHTPATVRIINQYTKSTFHGRVYTPTFAALHTSATVRTARQLQTSVDSNEPKARKLIGMCVLTTMAASLYGFFFSNEAKTMTHHYRAAP